MFSRGSNCYELRLQLDRRVDQSQRSSSAVLHGEAESALMD